MTYLCTFCTVSNALRKIIQCYLYGLWTVDTLKYFENLCKRSLKFIKGFYRRVLNFVSIEIEIKIAKIAKLKSRESNNNVAFGR